MPSAKNHHLVVGQTGEQLAADFLKKLHFKILTLNYRTPQGEVDIIAQDEHEIVFVEVKTRSHSYGIHPTEFVDDKKISRVFKAGLAFLRERHLFADYRLDIITILPNKIEHFRNVTL